MGARNFREYSRDRARNRNELNFFFFFFAQIPRRNQNFDSNDKGKERDVRFIEFRAALTDPDLKNYTEQSP